MSMAENGKEREAFDRGYACAVALMLLPFVQEMDKRAASVRTAADARHRPEPGDTCVSEYQRTSIEVLKVYDDGNLLVRRIDLHDDVVQCHPVKIWASGGDSGGWTWIPAGCAAAAGT